MARDAAGLTTRDVPPMIRQSALSTSLTELRQASEGRLSPYKVTSGLIIPPQNLHLGMGISDEKIASEGYFL